MRVNLLLPLLLAAGAPGVAHAGEVTVGASGGAVWVDSLEVIGNGVTVVPNAAYWFNPGIAAEIDVGVIMGDTQIARPEAFGYSVITPRVNLVGRLFPEKRFQLLLSLGAGAVLKKIDDQGQLRLPTGDATDLDVLGNAGPGFLLPFGKDPETSVVALRGDVRWLLNVGTENFENHGDAFLDWETTAGLLFRFGAKKDSDNDGILDEADHCIDQAEDMDTFEDDDGCPDLDNDKDGVEDAADQCQDKAEDKDSFEDTDGCPEDDNDKDGVVDSMDACADVFGVAAFKGCPDGDGDGVADADDECPKDAGKAEAGGCPDKDGDRVPDARDACPDKPANVGADPARSDGCPSRVFVAEKAIQITETVEFDTGKATIKPASFGLLDDIVRTLQKFPGIKKIQVEGHTDNAGDDAKNLKLSQERAAAVVKYLTDHGIDANRLVAKGFGETDPIADNATKDGQAKNRRVEFEILEQDMSQKAKDRLKDKDLPAAPAPAPK
jgi:outer membrane protein OmpA-like peptidoglycan-associated protein